MKREDDNFEPLGEVEQALPDAWLKVEETKGCTVQNDGVFGACPIDDNVSGPVTEVETLRLVD